MKAKTRLVIEAIISKLTSVVTGADYIHSITKVEGGQRSFDTSEMSSGVCVTVAFAGSDFVAKAGNAPNQQSRLSLVIDAHKHKAPGADIQAEGLDLLADLEKAVLGDTGYLQSLGFVRRLDASIESEDIKISEDGNAIVATAVFAIPYIKQYATPHEE